MRSARGMHRPIGCRAPWGQLGRALGWGGALRRPLSPVQVQAVVVLALVPVLRAQGWALVVEEGAVEVAVARQRPAAPRGRAARKLRGRKVPLRAPG